MQDSIYTIPVTEAYETPCECPICALEERFENDRVNYYLGPSLMEPDNRIETNDRGFCGHHYRKMYATQANRLGLGLMIDTHMNEQIARIRKQAGSAASAASGDNEKKSMLSMFKSRGRTGDAALSAICAYWKGHSKSCCICDDLEKTMKRYIDVLFSLYSSQEEFRARFRAGMGYCMPHFVLLAESAGSHLSGSKLESFNNELLSQQIANLERINEEINWFTKKFDYRNAEAPWGNSRDAIPRSIMKLTGERGLGDGNKA